jgi:hypothetical protein
MSTSRTAGFKTPAVEFHITKIVANNLYLSPEYPPTLFVPGQLKAQAGWQSALNKLPAGRHGLQLLR